MPPSFPTENAGSAEKKSANAKTRRTPILSVVTAKSNPPNDKETDPRTRSNFKPLEDRERQAEKVSPCFTLDFALSRMCPAPSAFGTALGDQLDGPEECEGSNMGAESGSRFACPA